MTKMKIEEEKIREETKENSRRVGKNSRNKKIQREKKRESKSKKKIENQERINRKIKCFCYINFGYIAYNCRDRKNVEKNRNF